MASRSRAAPSPLACLTPREREVLSLLAEGRSNAAVAEGLVLSERAVEKHINSIFAKLNLPGDPRRPPPGQGGAAVPGRAGLTGGAATTTGAHGSRLVTARSPTAQ